MAITPPTFSTTQKPTLLTLHALFPILLLPALDLLDRHLITRLVFSQDFSHGGPENTEAGAGRIRSESKRQRVVYYVKSNAHNSNRSRYSRHGDAAEVNYEVRTQAWNCSCAAFAFAAFNGSAAWAPNYQSYGHYDGLCHAAEEDEEMLDVPECDDGIREKGRDWQWGGLMLGEEEIPLCKHLLGCVLSERWDVAGGMVEERQVGREEIAGWAAGWGG